MAYDINAALERLENNLAGVESAKKQVEETIATSESLQQIIVKYTETFNAMSKDISAYIEELRNYQDIKTSDFSSAADTIKISCECVINKFNADVKASISSFDRKMADTIVNFGSENEKLQIQVNKLNSLQEVLNKATKEVNEVEKKVDVLATDLKKSQDEQDKVLVSVKSSLEALPSLVKSHTESVVSEVNKCALDLELKSEEINDKESKTIQKLDNNISVLMETKELCDDIKIDLLSVKNTLDSRFVSIEKSIKTNRWITILGILLLAVLYFIRN